MAKCKDLMGNPSRVCLVTDTAYEVANIMRNHSVSAVPVVTSKENQEFIGLVAERDIALKIVAEALTPQTTVGEIMTRNVATCGPEDDVEKALKLMDDLEIHHVPVVDESGRILGIIHKDVAA